MSLKKIAGTVAETCSEFCYRLNWWVVFPSLIILASGGGYLLGGGHYISGGIITVIMILLFILRNPEYWLEPELEPPQTAHLILMQIFCMAAPFLVGFSIPRLSVYLTG